MYPRIIKAFARTLFAITMCLGAGSLAATAQTWQVSQTESVLSYGSIKKGVLGEANLRRYIMNPQDSVPGTRMITRLSDENQVNDIIAYLKSK